MLFLFPVTRPFPDCNCDPDGVLEPAEQRIFTFHANIGRLPAGNYRVRAELKARYNGQPVVDGPWTTVKPVQDKNGNMTKVSDYCEFDVKAEKGNGDDLSETVRIKD